MGLNDSLQDTLEDLNAMILAADPGDTGAVAHLLECLSEIVQSMEPTTPSAELLTLGISGLQNIEKLNGPAVLSAVASAVAATSQCQCGTDEESLASLETATVALRKLLEPQDQELHGEVKSTPGPAGVDLLHTNAASAGTEMLSPGWEQELLPMFLVEGRDHIATAEAAILALEVNPDDSESINTVLRAFHTIKGSAGLVRLPQIQTLAHQAENLLIKARDGIIQMDHSNVDLALQSCDALKFMLDQVETISPGEEPMPPEGLEQLLGALSDTEKSDLAAKEDVQPTPSAAVPASRENATTDTIEKKTVESESPLGTNVSTEHESAETTAAATTTQPSQTTAPIYDTTLRVNTRRLDELVNWVGELVITHSILAQDVSVIEGDHEHLTLSVAHTGKIVRQLQGLAMSLRMVPFKDTFHKMSRIVRDLAHKSDKSISFTTSGEDTEIDRNMVQVLNDPLMHMIRNALDHGIESAAERAKCGKSLTGMLHLRAYHAGDNVVIELEDDGRGLDRDKIIRQAVKRGLVEVGQEMSNDEVYSLIFHPGFSTAEQVTDVSGRGVGMDVVRRNVESLRGHIGVSTRPGAGTTITLFVPLTMAILDAMLLGIGGQQYLLPTIAVQRSFRPEPGSISTVAGRAEMVMTHGKLYPLVRLYKLFDIDGAITDPQQAMVIIIEGAGKRCAFMVDEILGQRQVVIKSLGKALADVPGVVGGAIMGNGRVGIILDAIGLVQLAHDPMPAVSLANTHISPSRNPTTTAFTGGSP